MNEIGIQFLKNSISIAYYNNDKLIGKTISIEEEIEASEYVIILNRLLEDLDLHNNKKYRVVISIPHDLVEVFALKQLVPVTKNFLTKKRKQNLIMGQIENILERSSQEYMIEYDIIDEKQLYNNKLLATIICTKIEDCVKYVNVVASFKNLIPSAIDTEAEALRRLLPIEQRNIAIINVFKNDKDMVGIYIYMGSKLIAIRYLYKDLYDTDSLIAEVERMLIYCKTFYREFEVNMWYAFGPEEKISDLFERENIVKHELATCSFAVSAGLAIKEEYEKKRITANKKGGEV